MGNLLTFFLLTLSGIKRVVNYEYMLYVENGYVIAIDPSSQELRKIQVSIIESLLETIFDMECSGKDIKFTIIF